MATILRDKAVHAGGGHASLQQWVEQDIADGWVAAFRLEWTGSQHVIAELRVVRGSTNDTSREPGESAPLPDERYWRTSKPFPFDATDGLTARVARRAHFQEVLSVARDALERQIAESNDPAATRRYLQVARLAEQRDGPADRGRFWSDEDYVRLAAAYVDAVRGGSRRPIADLKGTWHGGTYSAARIRQALAHARECGWLSPTAERRPGGEITEEGFAVLDRAAKEKK